MAFQELSRSVIGRRISFAQLRQGAPGSARWAKVGHERPSYWSPSWSSAGLRLACISALLSVVAMYGVCYAHLHGRSGPVDWDAVYRLHFTMQWCRVCGQQRSVESAFGPGSRHRDGLAQRRNRSLEEADAERDDPAEHGDGGVERGLDWAGPV